MVTTASVLVVVLGAVAILKSIADTTTSVRDLLEILRDFLKKLFLGRNGLTFSSH